MSFYDDDCPVEEYVQSYQDMINSGMAWRMEGAVGREAMRLIEGGYCTLGETGHSDYWGNYVPSKYEVKAGTKGSAEYCREKTGYTG